MIWVKFKIQFELSELGIDTAFSPLEDRHLGFVIPLRKYIKNVSYITAWSWVKCWSLVDPVYCISHPLKAKGMTNKAMIPFSLLGLLVFLVCLYLRFICIRGLIYIFAEWVKRSFLITKLNKWVSRNMR